MPWQFSLVMQKGGENTTIGSGYIAWAKSPSSVLRSVLTHTYFKEVPEPCSVDDDLNSLKLRAFETEAYFNMISAIITSASLLPLPSPSSFPFYNVKFAATTPKPPGCGQGEGASPFMQDVTVTLNITQQLCDRPQH